MRRGARGAPQRERGRFAAARKFMRAKTLKTVLIVAVAVLSAPFCLLAQTDRSYFYENISQVFSVNADTTVDVSESQTYRFIGSYNKGWRGIPLKGVSDIFDVRVIDADTMMPLELSHRPLDKTLPSSWGKYFYQKSGGVLGIEWYYSAQDTSRTWILEYRLAGAISFLKYKDELYWNLFSGYDAPVLRAEAVVRLPENSFDRPDLSGRIYTENGAGSVNILDNRTFHFVAENIEPGQAVTIASGWPRGLVNRTAFWLGLLKSHYAFVSSLFLLLATFASMFAYWYWTEKRKTGRGVVVPQYEPPKTPDGKRTPPAAVDLLVREGLSPRAWSATIVDLAVRGYVRINEEAPHFLTRVAGVAITTILPVVLWYGITSRVNMAFALATTILLCAWTVFFIAKSWKRGYGFAPPSYKIKKLAEFKDDETLWDYEKKFLHALFFRDDTFSTDSSRMPQTARKELYENIKKAEGFLSEEMDKSGGIYEKSVYKGVYATQAMIMTGILGMFMLPISFEVQSIVVVVIVFAICCLGLFLFIKYEARLSKEGEFLREDWLGFKMYLETAERYRMQNLTPEIFEKYLPYAIIFKVEKKWGKAFEGVLSSPPEWSGSSAGGFAGGRGVSGGFSASAFSASFSASFASAFRSSGGSGASGGGGGGGAGGGGGGGGGGAS